MTLVYYRGTYEPPAANLPPVEEITISSAPVQGFEEILPTREGLLLLDDDHFNNFDEEEINILLARVADRGYTIELLDDRQQLAGKLNDADTFVVILPLRSYTKEEVDTVEEFVDKGGKLLLVGDPGRPSNINSLARGFGIVFQPGYLYNVFEHDLNFQNIFVKDFRPDEITQGLGQVALYNAGPIESSGIQLATTDSNTYSSMVQRTEAFSPLVKGRDGRVLAISDLTFMISPNNSVWDNERFIANLADYLTKSERVLFE
ncbi:MAG: DUF4350 domain-containing protein [Dehalococcoidia bacterium]